MTLSEFNARFGASCRRKHLMPPEGRQYPIAPGSSLPRGLIRLDPWEADYLFLVSSLATRGIVEIGRLRGGSTFLLACANAGVPIWSIDNEPEGDDRLRAWFSRYRVGRNVQLLVGDSQRDELPGIGEFDLLFVDGDHSYEGCSVDLGRFFPGLLPGGHVLIHDCYGGHPVQRAVLDFVSGTPVQIVRSPYIPARHWLTDYGSFAHLRKPASGG